MRLLRSALALGAALAGCLGAPQRSRQAISSGSDDSDDPSVVAIGERRIECADTLALVCSGTLIAPSVVLSAAHCFAGRGPITRYETYQGSAIDNAGELHHVVDLLLHPDYDPTTHAADLALLRLDSPSSTTPVPLPSAAPDASFVGRPLRVVGFGVSAPAQGAGQKRQGLSTISAVDADTLRLQPDPALPCDGDSGGPGLLDEGAGEVLAAVTAAGDAACASFGLDVRVDPFVDSFIRPYLAQPPPAPSPGIALDAICSGACAGDGDCPAGLACGPGQRCVLGGAPAGQFGAACPSSCTSCVRVDATDSPTACRCFSACSVGLGPPGLGSTGGCDLVPSYCPPFPWLWLIFALGFVQILNKRSSKF